MRLPMPTSSLANRRVVVMGLGRFGGGVGVTRFLANQGARVLVTDKEPAEKLQDSLASLADLHITYRLGEHRISDFTDADLIVVNPAVRPMNNPCLAAAQQAGAKLTSEIRLLVERLPNRRRTIGITGSAGKSTTTTMVGDSLLAEIEKAKRREIATDKSEIRNPKSEIRSTRNPEPETRNLFLGGNLGGSLLSRLDQIGHDDWVVLELSSFMLQGLREDRWSPHIALITNLAPNHLDWHGSFDHYRTAKQALLDFQRDDDIAILGPGATGFTSPLAPSQVRDFSSCDMSSLPGDIPPLLIPGEHNRINAAMAVQVCIAAGLDRSQAAGHVSAFAGLPHRLQFVDDRDGVRHYNDSKCTTPEAAMLALRSFDAGRVHLILGGYDKGADLAPLAAFARSHCKSIHTIGATGPAIAAAAEAAAGGAIIVESETLENAMLSLQKVAERGDVILLSPACASWDQFTNFEARGAAFMKLASRDSTSRGRVQPDGT